ncbi:hypothetical protein [uncultured Chitinophaga sp.]|jgi:hypothetical protein|uniref:hypothetical protein n=1 Tax=uncultured Chitinophaga sp. TaxID=339340 RepID=UPI002620E718|nr:hypothetical protein [uncultured Chitinophaga sp.]
MKSGLYIAVFLLFCTYWLATIFFVAPANPLNISADIGREIFNTHFYQRWSFFAPPPTYNQRVYIIFKNTTTKHKDVFEAIAPIVLAKHEKAPFNEYYQKMDYILASSLINIEGNVKLLHDVFASKSMQSLFKEKDTSVKERIVNDIEKTSDFRTLIKYARKIADENGINKNDVSCQVIITKVYIPQFVDRKLQKGKEEIAFSSHPFNL